MTMTTAVGSKLNVSDCTSLYIIDDIEIWLDANQKPPLMNHNSKHISTSSSSSSSNSSSIQSRIFFVLACSSMMSFNFPVSSREGHGHRCKC